ncbi:autotransporter domain-containing protein [Tahibacter soli]|uniref:Autotransporter domain-containing protein n=1 Tax=Tahibacter soli TaxID=2983605 RepID=A0A9X4BJS6_9GAMM|nr:autotransporter domain-containing protein [Tahibacter soli]MDC8015401.1 autotransporter domain-containing protein [Tahibacter soli]
MKRDEKRRWSAALRRLAGCVLPLLAALPVVGFAQTYSGVQVTTTGTTYPFGARNFPADATLVRLAIVASPGGDALASPTAPLTAGQFENSISVGAAPGVRVIRFCYDTATTTCDPTAGNNIIHLGAVTANCTLTAPQTSGPAPLAVNATANCTVTTGANVRLDNGAYNWTLPPGAGVTPPPAVGGPSTATFTLTTPGNYNARIAPTLNFSITRTVVFNDTQPATNNPVPATPVTLPLQVTTATNQAPTAQITSPADNQTFDEPASFAISANAADTDGTIASVQFLLDGASIGTDAAPPYSIAFPANKPAGTYTLVARATDNAGATGESVPVRVVVLRRVQRLDVVTPYADLRFTPGREIEVRIRASGGLGPVANQDLDWTVAGGGSTAQPGVCPASDTPRTGSLRTDANGEIAIRFVPSCATTARNLTVATAAGTTPAISTVVRLRGPRDIELVLTAPRDGATYDEADAFELRATLTDPDDRVASVEFTANGTPVGSASAAPHAIRWPANQPPGTYRIAVRAIERTGAIIDGDAVTIQITRRAGALTVLTTGTDLVFVPGEPVRLRVRATSAQGGPAANERLTFAIGDAAAAKAACAPADTPSQGSVVTDANGEALIEFVPGCASNSRRVTIASATDPSVQASVVLRGPDANANALGSGIDAQAIVAMPGTATPVPVTVAATNGQPIVGATLEFALQPANAGTISATATSDAQGHASASLVLGDGTTAASVRVCVRGRPDLCTDIPVRSATLAVIRPAAELVAPVLRQSVETARVQLSQIRSHLAMSRSGNGHGFANGLNVRVGGASVPAAGSAQSKDGEDGAGADTQPFGFFVAGDVDVGERDSRGGLRNGFKVTTRGITAGVDYRFSSAFVAGAALGAMRASTDLANGGAQDASGTSFSLFGQWLPTDRWYLNGVFNVGRNSYDIERRLYDGSALFSDTDSRQRALQFEAGYAFARNAFKFTPFLRYEIVRADIDAIRERGDSIDALYLSDTGVSSDTLSTGAYFEYAFSGRSGVWIPSLRVEFFGEDRDQEEMVARLLAGDAGAFAVPEDDADERYGSVGFNLQWLTGTRGQPISSFIGIERSFGRADYRATRYTLGVKIPF